MNDLTIGTCSICGGRVCVPSVWISIIPPTPHCEGCGAVPVEAHGPVIPMRQARTWCYTTTTDAEIKMV